MGEAKRRAEHRPPMGMVNVSGKQVTDLARGIQDLLAEPFDKGMQADLAAHVLVVSAVDLWRVNYGDAHVRAALIRAIDQRLEHPVEYWGGRRMGGAPVEPKGSA